jgi:hypothetical protein
MGAKKLILSPCLLKKVQAALLLLIFLLLAKRIVKNLKNHTNIVTIKNPLPNADGVGVSGVDGVDGCDGDGGDVDETFLSGIKTSFKKTITFLFFQTENFTKYSLKHKSFARQQLVSVLKYLILRFEEKFE